MTTILDTLKKFFEEEDWSYEPPDEDGRIWTRLQGKHGAAYDAFFAPQEDLQQMTVGLTLPLNVPEGKRLAMAELIARANLGILMGNFDLDMDDGRMMFRIGIDVEEGVLSTKMVVNMVEVCAIMMDLYFPAIMAVCYAEKSPKDAAADVLSQVEEARAHDEANG